MLLTGIVEKIGTLVGLTAAAGYPAQFVSPTMQPHTTVLCPVALGVQIVQDLNGRSGSARGILKVQELNRVGSLIQVGPLLARRF